MVVEDDHDTAQLLKEMLEAEGFQVILAGDGPTGLEAACQEPPDLFLLDVMMPGMDGFEFCRKIRSDRRCGEIPVLILTAKDELEEKMKGFQAGADDYITKPFILAEVLARVKVHLRLLHLKRGLALSEERYRMIVENSPDGIISISAAGELLFHNRRFKEILRGKMVEPLTGRVLTSLYPLSDLFREISTLIDRIRISQENVFRETQLTSSNQMNLYLELLGMPIIGDNDGIQMFLILIRDITERRKVEEALVQAEKINSLGILTAGIAHEVNNPLTGISNAVQLLKKADLVSERRVELCSLILDNIDRIAKIVKDLHIFSRPHESSSKMFSISEAVSATLSLVKYQIRRGKITVEFRDSDKDLMLFGDRNHFQQVMVNLLVNAIQAIQDTGHITITLEQKGENAQIIVADTGCGIPADQIQQIFTPFFTTKRDWKGTGLGLAVTYRIIQLFKGTISVQTSVGQGTRFTISIPFYQVPRQRR
jgi:PAS domain S-box-containing protein